MDPEVGKWIVIAFATVGAAVWLAGLWFMIGATRERQARAMEAAQRFEIEETAAAGTIVGEAEVAGQPEELSAKLASLLVREGMGPFGPIKIVACDHRELVFEAAGMTTGASGHTPSGGVRRGRFRLTPSGSRTRVEYAIEVPTGRILLGLGWLFVLLGLVALLAVCAIMFTYILPSPNPNVRGQAFQMVQVVHFLWPPFLLGSLSRQPARFVRGSKHWCITCPIPDGQARVSDETLEARSYLTRRFRPGGHESKGRRCRWSQRLHGRAVETLYSSISSGSAQSSRFRFSKTCAAEATTTMTSASG